MSRTASASGAAKRRTVKSSLMAASAERGGPAVAPRIFDLERDTAQPGGFRGVDPRQRHPQTGAHVDRRGHSALPQGFRKDVPQIPVRAAVAALRGFSVARPLVESGRGEPGVELGQFFECLELFTAEPGLAGIFPEPECMLEIPLRAEDPVRMSRVSGAVDEAVGVAE